MNNTMEYKGYVGSVELSEKDDLLFGKVQGIRSLISYEGNTVAELTEDFHGAIDDYLDQCKAEGIKPEKTYRGSFNVRIGSNLHRQAAIYALSQGETLNHFIEDAVKDKLKNVL